MNSSPPPQRPERRRPDRRRRIDGEQSRAAILGEAARLATVEGIGGLSIARLAEAVGMSKSGLFAHFGSKEALQLATVRTAAEVFDLAVVDQAAPAPAGLPRLEALVEAYLAYVQSDVFPGGCFFAAVLTETSMQPGPVRDAVVEFLDAWMARLEGLVRDAQEAGELDPAEDPAQLAFEIESAFYLANTQFVVGRDPVVLDRARRSIRRRLDQGRPEPAVRARGSVRARAAAPRRARPAGASGR